jgi:hypothetical protein
MSRRVSTQRELMLRMQKEEKITAPRHIQAMNLKNSLIPKPVAFSI